MNDTVWLVNTLSNEYTLGNKINTNVTVVYKLIILIVLFCLRTSLKPLLATWGLETTSLVLVKNMLSIRPSITHAKI